MKEADRCRNFFAMGLVFWLYDRLAGADAALYRREIRQEAGKVAEANRRALQAGYNYGETTEAFASHFARRQGQAAAGQIPQHHRQPGRWPGA